MKFSFHFGRILFNLARAFAECREALFLPFLTSLLITYLVITSRLAKEIIVVENVLNCGSKNLYEPWIKQLTNSNTKSLISFHEIETHHPMNKRERLFMSPTLFFKNIFRAKVQISRFNTKGFSQDSQSPGLETRNSCCAFALGKETTGVLQGTCY